MILFCVCNKSTIFASLFEAQTKFNMAARLTIGRSTDDKSQKSFLWKI